MLWPSLQENDPFGDKKEKLFAVTARRVFLAAVEAVGATAMTTLFLFR